MNTDTFELQAWMSEGWLHVRVENRHGAQVYNDYWKEEAVDAHLSSLQSDAIRAFHALGGSGRIGSFLEQVRPARDKYTKQSPAVLTNYASPFETAMPVDALSANAPVEYSDFSF